MDVGQLEVSPPPLTWLGQVGTGKYRYDYRCNVTLWGPLIEGVPNVACRF